MSKDTSTGVNIINNFRMADEMDIDDEEVVSEPQLRAAEEGMAVEDDQTIPDPQAMGDHIQILPPTGAEIEFRDGDLVLTWSKCANHDDRCSYRVKIFETNNKFCELITQGTEYRIPRAEYSPIKYYTGMVTTWRNGVESEVAKAVRQMLCTKLADGNVYLDESSRLSPDHSVYIGYMKGVLTDKVAVKLVDVRENSLEKGRFEREVRSLMDLGTLENVVTFRDSGKVKGIGNRHFIAMELCCKDNLKDILKKDFLKDKPDEMKNVLLHIMRGLSRIHESNILHRDLKLDNILRSSDQKSMKICDFGLSKQFSYDKSKMSKSGAEIGTDGWGSPEHYGVGKPMSRKSDIFSAGLVYCYVLSEGRHACGDKRYKWKSNIIEKVPIKLPDFKCDDPAVAADLVKAMLEFDPDRRPSSKDVLAHPFFWSNEKKLDFIHRVSSYFQRMKNGSHAITIVYQIQYDFGEMAEGFTDWQNKLDDPWRLDGGYLSKLAGGKFGHGKYHHTLLELIRFIRNIEEHHTQHPDSVALFNNKRANVWIHFSAIFPNLLPGLFHIFHKHLSDMEEVPQLSDIRGFLMQEPLYSLLRPF